MFNILLNKTLDKLDDYSHNHGGGSSGSGYTTSRYSSPYTLYSYSPTPSYRVSSSTASSYTTNGPHSSSDDVFLSLKQHCARNYDSICITKRRELHELVAKCERLTIQNRHQTDTCREVLSIYCYVFYNKDLITCFDTTQYDIYVPGKKKFTTVSSTTSTRTTTTSKYVYYSSSTTKPTITTTTTKSTTTTRPTVKVVTTPSTTTSTRASLSGDPFGNGPLTIPTESDGLKHIAKFCLQSREKNVKCDKMLVLLKDKFKTCEKKPKTDTECQSFKMNFCGAFKNFPCCSEVLAGRSCNGKSIRSFLF